MYAKVESEIDTITTISASYVNQYLLSLSFFFLIVENERLN